MQFPRIRSAPFMSFFPIQMAAWGAPPAPTRAAKAEIRMITGKVTPSPARARWPTSGIRPT